jgi:hypothetical protein
MKHFAEKAEKHFFVRSEKIESSIVVYPVVWPIVIVNSVLPDVPGYVAESAIAGRQTLKVEDSAEKFDFVESPTPRCSFDSEAIKDVPTRGFGDAHD